jgi:membrane protein implicated in regulation of membrane protease activity
LPLAGAQADRRRRLSFEVLFPLLGVILLLVAWPLARRRVRPNRWYGLRVPATFADEWVWYEANAIAGRDMMLLGAVLLVLALALPTLGVRGTAYATACSLVLGLGSLMLAVRGWRLANRLLRERRGGSGAA